MNVLCAVLSVRAFGFRGDHYMVQIEIATTFVHPSSARLLRQKRAFALCELFSSSAHSWEAYATDFC